MTDAYRTEDNPIARLLAPQLAASAAKREESEAAWRAQLADGRVALEELQAALPDGVRVDLRRELDLHRCITDQPRCDLDAARTERISIYFAGRAKVGV